MQIRQILSIFLNHLPWCQPFRVNQTRKPKLHRPILLLLQRSSNCSTSDSSFFYLIIVLVGLSLFPLHVGHSIRKYVWWWWWWGIPPLNACICLHLNSSSSHAVWTSSGMQTPLYFSFVIQTNISDSARMIWWVPPSLFTFHAADNTWVVSMCDSPRDLLKNRDGILCIST